MSVEAQKATLRDCTNGLLRNPDLHPRIWTEPLGELFKSLIGGEAELGTHHQYVAGGCAICPLDAARSLDQSVRTQKFLRGLFAAIREAQKRFPNQTIHVLYAGSGPFGTLVTPLTTQFAPHEVQFTAIEIHKNAVACFRKIVDALEIGGYFADIVQTDAIKYHPRNTPHIVVTETMYCGLLDEPQAAITANLAPHLPDDGIFVPEEVSVSAFLTPADNLEDELNFGRKELGPVVSLRKNIHNRVDGASCLDIDREFDIPAIFVNHDLYLDTRVKIFDGEVLELGESNITSPHRVGVVKASQGEKRLRIQYTMGNPKEYVAISIGGKPLNSTRNNGGIIRRLAQRLTLQLQ